MEGGGIVLHVLLNLLAFCSILCVYLMNYRIAFHDDPYMLPMLIALTSTVYLRINTSDADKAAPCSHACVEPRG